jgi:hypothetical protein
MADTDALGELAATDRYGPMVAPDVRPDPRFYQWLGISNLTNPATYQDLPPPSLTPNAQGKLPQSDPRVLGGLADLTNVAQNFLPLGGSAAGAAKAAVPVFGGLGRMIAREAPTGMDALNDVLRSTTNRGIIDSLPAAPTTHSARIAARTKGMSDADVLQSDELWAMTRDLMAHRADAGSAPAFSQAFSELASRRLGRPLTPEEVSTALLDATRAGIATPRKVYGPER